MKQVVSSYEPGHSFQIEIRLCCLAGNPLMLFSLQNRTDANCQHHADQLLVRPREIDLRQYLLSVYVELFLIPGFFQSTAAKNLEIGDALAYVLSTDTIEVIFSPNSSYILENLRGVQSVLWIVCPDRSVNCMPELSFCRFIEMTIPSNLIGKSAHYALRPILHCSRIEILRQIFFRQGMIAEDQISCEFGDALTAVPITATTHQVLKCLPRHSNLAHRAREMIEVNYCGLNRKGEGQKASLGNVSSELEMRRACRLSRAVAASKRRAAAGRRRTGRSAGCCSGAWSCCRPRRPPAAPSSCARRRPAPPAVAVGCVVNARPESGAGA